MFRNVFATILLLHAILNHATGWPQLHVLVPGQIRAISHYGRPVHSWEIKIAHFWYSGWVTIHKATEDKTPGNKRISLGIFIVSPEPRLQLFCAWSLNQNIESQLLSWFEKIALSLNKGGHQFGWIVCGNHKLIKN